MIKLLSIGNMNTKNNGEPLLENRFLRLMSYNCSGIKYLSCEEMEELSAEIKNYLEQFDRTSLKFTDMFRKSVMGKLNAINGTIVQAQRTKDNAKQT